MVREIEQHPGFENDEILYNNNNEVEPTADGREFEPNTDGREFEPSPNSHVNVGAERGQP